jgi:prepilin-type N-terminal cleavage/methylation domain-containing protein
MNIQKQKKGFTLIELLMTVALIGVLLGIVIVSVDPVEQFANARNRQREADTSALVLAIERYVSNNDGSLPGGVDETDKAICQSSCLTDGSQVSLTVLQPYLAEGTLPRDPSEEDPVLTGYTIRVTEGRNVYVGAPNAENGATIGFGQESATGGPFEVTDLPELELWLKADEGVIRNDSNQVSLWESQTLNRLESQQPFESQMPLWVENAVNTQPTVRFDGVNDFMQVVGTDINNISELSIIMVTSSLSNQDPEAAFTGGGFSPIYFEETGVHGSSWLSIHQNKITWRLGTGFYDADEPTVYTRPGSLGTNFSLTMLVRNGVTEDLYVDGASVAQFTADQEFIGESRQALWLGRSSEGFGYFHGDIAEVILTKKALTATERLELETYLNTKYGL